MNIELGPAHASGLPSMLYALVCALVAGLLAAHAARWQLWALWGASVAGAAVVGVLEMRRDEIPGPEVVILAASAAALWVATAIFVTRRIARRPEAARELRRWRFGLSCWLGMFIIRFAWQIHRDGGLVQPDYWSGEPSIASPIGEVLAVVLAGSLLFGALLFGPPLLVTQLLGLDVHRRDEPVPSSGPPAT